MARVPKKRQGEDAPEAIACKRLRSMWEQSTCSDLNVQCGTRLWKVHQAVLSVASPVFEAMLKSGMQEGKTRCIKIKDAPAEVINDLLQFIYLGSATCLEPLQPQPQPACRYRKSMGSLGAVKDQPCSRNEDAEDSDEEAERAVDPEVDPIYDLFQQAAMYQMPDLLRLCTLQLLASNTIDAKNIVVVMRSVRNFKSDPRFAAVLQPLEALVRNDQKLFWALMEQV